MKPLLSFTLAGICALCLVSCMKANTSTTPSAIDSLQTFTDSLLLQKLMKKEAEWGCVILMSVKSGEVIVLSNFDRNEDGTYSVQKNHAEESMYPGSVIQTYRLMCWLDEGKTRLNDTCTEDSIILRRFGRSLTVRQAFASGTIPNNDTTLFTPLEIVRFYNRIANGNELVEQNICGEPALRDIKSALHDVVWDNEYGTASVDPWGMRKAQSNIVHIAGKTGAVRIYKNDNRKHRVSFAGYFPEEDPEYTCLCIIHCPKSYYDAGTDCGATVRRIAERIMKQKCSSQTTPAWVQELKEKNPLKDKRNYTCVYFKYDTIVDNYEVRGMFFPSYIDGWFYESGVCMYLRNVVTGEEYEFTDYTSDCNAFKSIFMSKNVYDIIEDSAFTGFKDGDYYIFKYHNEHDTLLCQDSNERVIYPLKSQAEFQLFDVDFDGENELLISYYQGGPYQSTIYDVYELRGESLTKRSLEINSTSLFDAKQKTMSTTVSDGNSQTSYYVYESPEKGTMNLKWHIIQRANYDNDTIIRDTIFGNM